MASSSSEASRCHDRVSKLFHDLSNGIRTDTKFTTLNILRDTYKDYHVTEVDGCTCELFDFAKEGKAILKFDEGNEQGNGHEGKDYFIDEVYGKIWKGDGNKIDPVEISGEKSRFEEEMGGLGGSFNAARQWVPVGTGVEKKMHPGKLEDEYRFVHFQYTWDEKTYIVYYISFRENFQASSRIFYILYPHSAFTSTTPPPRHCPPTDALILACSKWTSQLHSEIWVFDNGSWSKSRSLWDSISTSSWDDVILDPVMKSSLITDVQSFFDSRDLYNTYAVPWKRGIILHGVPGNGKTVSIKALVNSLHRRDDQVSSLYVKSFEASHTTEQDSIRRIFRMARRCAPCLVIFEDLDSLVADDIRSYFLNEVDGLESNDGILMIGSTNHLDRLDPAIAKRPSRFDRKYHFKLPDQTERNLYAEYWRKKLVAKNEELDFPQDMCKVISAMTEGFSFAYLKELFIMALLGLVRSSFKGDDFEIVDEDEAASVAEENQSSKDQQQEKPKQDDAEPNIDTNLCTCAQKCHTCGKPVPTSTPDSTSSASTSASTSSSPPSSRPSLSHVPIPPHLIDNTLLKVIKHQIRILHAEMDNTKTEEWPSGKDISGRRGRKNSVFQQIKASMRNF